MPSARAPGGWTTAPALGSRRRPARAGVGAPVPTPGQVQAKQRHEEREAPVATVTAHPALREMHAALRKVEVVMSAHDGQLRVERDARREAEASAAESKKQLAVAARSQRDLAQAREQLDRAEETEEVLRQQLREQKVELGEARRGLAGANEQNRQLRTELEALQRRLSDAGLGWGSGAPQRPGGQRWGTLAWWGDKRAP
jgi:hypothetical protein